MSLLILAISVYIAAILETSLANRWELRGATPDLLAMVAFIWLTAKSHRQGLLPVALIGLASDLGSAAPLGLGMATLTCVGYGVVRLKPRLDTDHFYLRLATIWFAATTAALVQGIGLHFLGEAQTQWQLLIERCAITGLYTAGIAFPLLMVGGWFRKPDPVELRNAYA